MGPYSKMIGVLIKRGDLVTDSWGDCHVKMKVEIGVMLLQAKESKVCLQTIRS